MHEEKKILPDRIFPIIIIKILINRITHFMHSLFALSTLSLFLIMTMPLSRCIT
jgi:hypothetical protein